MKTYDPLNTLKPIDDGIWMVDGPIIEMDFPFGTRMPFPTRMVVVRLANGDVWVHSPIAGNPNLFESVEQLGPVRHILASNSIHYWYVPEWQTQFPDATVYGPSGLEQSAKREITLDKVFSDKPEAAWENEIEQLLFEGSVITEAVFYHKPSATLIVSDLIENFEPSKVESAWLRLLLLVTGILDPKGSMPIDLRLTFWNNRKQIADKIKRIQAWEPKHVIMAHGRPYLENGTTELRRAFRWANRFL